MKSWKKFFFFFCSEIKIVLREQVQNIDTKLEDKINSMDVTTHLHDAINKIKVFIRENNNMLRYPTLVSLFIIELKKTTVVQLRKNMVKKKIFENDTILNMLGKH